MSSQQIQDLITENEIAATETEAMGSDALRRAELVAEVSRAVTSQAHRQVMSGGELLPKFQAWGGDEQALQRLLAEAIGSMDAHMERMVKNAREFGVASMARAQTLREQAEKLRRVMADTAPSTRQEPDIIRPTTVTHEYRCGGIEQ